MAELDWRAERIRRALDHARLDGLLVYAPGWRRENFRYLTSALTHGSFAFAYLPRHGEPTAFVGSAADAAAVCGAGWISDVRSIDFPSVAEIGDRIAADGARRVGVSQLELVPEILMDGLLGGASQLEPLSATPLMDGVRLVKSEYEIEQIRRAVDVCVAGFSAFVGALEPGTAEYAVVAAVEAEIKRLGAQDNFMLIASGGDDVRGMTPPGDRTLRRGDMVRTELTPSVDGYYAQICRTAVLGAPSSGQQASAELFREALEAGLAVVRAGVTAGEIATAENDVFRRHGLGEYTTSEYTRVRGHAQGLHVDEAPPLLEGNDTVLEENAVIIVHPNTYTPLAGYHVLGDPVVVTRDGYEPLLRTRHDLISVPA